MMLIFLNFGGGGYNWYAAPLFLVLMLNTSAIVQLLEFVLSTITNFWSGITGWLTHESPTSSGMFGVDILNFILVSFLCCFFLSVIFYFSFAIYSRIRAVGVQRTLVDILELCFLGWRGFIGREGVQPAMNEDLISGLRYDKYKKRMREIPCEVFKSVEDLQALSRRELKETLRHRRIRTDGLVEKQDLVKALLDSDNTSSKSCSICFNDYVSGEVLKVLPCGHKYHGECIEKWFSSASRYTDTPLKCPYCNTSILS